MSRVKKTSQPLSLSLDLPDNENTQNLSDSEVIEKAIASLKPLSKSKKNNKNLVEENIIANANEAESIVEIANNNNNSADQNDTKSERSPRSRNLDDSINQRYIYYRDQKDIVVPKVLSLIEQLQNLIPTGRFKIQTEEVKRAKEAKKAERAARREEKEKQALRAKSEKITAELDGRILPKAPPKVPKKREKKDKEKNKNK